MKYPKESFGSTLNSISPLNIFQNWLLLARFEHNCQATFGW